MDAQQYRAKEAIRLEHAIGLAMYRFKYLSSGLAWLEYDKHTIHINWSDVPRERINLKRIKLIADFLHKRLPQFAIYANRGKIVMYEPTPSNNNDDRQNT